MKMDLGAPSVLEMADKEFFAKCKVGKFCHPTPVLGWLGRDVVSLEGTEGIPRFEEENGFGGPSVLKITEKISLQNVKSVNFDSSVRFLDGLGDPSVF